MVSRPQGKTCSVRGCDKEAAIYVTGDPPHYLCGPHNQRTEWLVQTSDGALVDFGPGAWTKHIEEATGDE